MIFLSENIVLRGVKYFLSFLKIKFIIIKWNTLKIACSVLRWRSVKTKRGFFGTAECSETIGWLSSFLLHVVAKKVININNQYLAKTKKFPII